MRPNEGGHRLYAVLAAQGFVEVASVWVASPKTMGYLWHLSNALVEGMRTLTPARLGDGPDGDYAELLEVMIILHNSLDWVSIQPFFRRTRPRGGRKRRRAVSFIAFVGSRRARCCSKRAWG